MTDARALRHQLREAGYCPIPLYGKEPPIYGKNNQKKGLGKWQQLHEISTEQIDMWSKTWPDAENTGCLCRLMPTLDVDVLDEAATRAIAELVRDRYEDAGYVLIRVGKPPKFAIPFRTEEPFKKFVANLIAPDGSEVKIEFLADGEQLVVAGIHPETKEPYRWLNGEPGQIKHEDLPYIREAEARALVWAIVELLIRDFGYKRAPSRTKANGGAVPKAHDGGGGGDRDWGALTENILTGRELHDSITIFAAKLIASGMNSGAAVNYLRGLMDKSAAPKDDRHRARVLEIPAAVDSAVAKYGKAPTARSSSESEAELDRPEEPDDAAAEIIGTLAVIETADGISVALVITAPSGYTIHDALAVFTKWLILPSPTPFYAMVGTIAANRLPGTPVWLGLVAPPSSAKTEMLKSCEALPHVQSSGTLTEAALLSGVPKKQHAHSAKGGLLREIGAFGILLLKDFGTILSMHPENKAKLLAALREIFDGSWRRDFGTDGGKSLSWKGKLGLIFGVTGAIDQHRTIDDELGNRYLLSRLGPDDDQFDYALKHAFGATTTMQQELRGAINKLFSVPTGPPRALASNSDEFRALKKTIKLVVRLRGATARDRYKRELEYVYGVEGTGRIGLCLNQLLAGLDSLGLDRTTAFEVVTSVAMDSVPPLRRAAYEFLCEQKDAFGALESRTTADVAEALDYPTNTIRRVLEDLAVYHLVKRVKGGSGKADRWYAVPVD